jgi:predicted nucleotidyltransferase
MPMQRDDVLDKLRAAEPALRAAGVGALFLYGSLARGEAHARSDVDIFLDQANPEDFDLLDLLALSDDIKAMLGGAEVDLVTRGSLHPLLRPVIEAGALRVF